MAEPRSHTGLAARESGKSASSPDPGCGSDHYSHHFGSFALKDKQKVSESVAFLIKFENLRHFSGNIANRLTWCAQESRPKVVWKAFSDPSPNLSHPSFKAPYHLLQETFILRWRTLSSAFSEHFICLLSRNFLYSPSLMVMCIQVFSSMSFFLTFFFFNKRVLLIQYL